MTRSTALSAFLVAAPLPFAAALTQHPTGGTDLYELISANQTAWMAVHYTGAVFFPLMALVLWQLVRGLPGRAASVTRYAMPVFAVFYGVYEALFGIANGLIANTASGLGGAERQGAIEAIDDIVASPIVGEPGLLVSLGSIAWWAGIAGAIVALRRAGAGTPALLLLAVGGLLTFHIHPIGPIALVALSGAALLVERRRAHAGAVAVRAVPA